jgi:hypothetical protein
VKRHLLVFVDGDGDDLDLKAFVDTLDERTEISMLYDHVCFVRSEPTASEIFDRFVKCAATRLFFVADISNSVYSGRMLSSFWDHFKKPALTNAAE